ncbi:MAG: phosphoribosylformylglycinamidine cyclo-ligase [Chloroflexi bacterium]|nr:phosphoribosylformylglycinamidine cyclo-ligase [Chloroflexota bacterium]
MSRNVCGRLHIKEKYAEAGVDINLATRAKKLIGEHVRSTFRPEVLGDYGFFGGMFEFKGYRHPVLVSHTDGVGTKLKIAIAMDKHDTIGIDIVSHCVNDILTTGAEPLFFQDYIALGKMSPERVESIVRGLAQGCRDVGCALIGGETAEMPGMYAGDDYDLAGFIVGAVEKENIITGSAIKAGDAIIGLPSSGLHTNGYSLARKIFGEDPKILNTRVQELGRTLGEALLEPHICYFRQLKPLLPSVKGMAHITGGGLPGNVSRILPQGVAADFHEGSWEAPAIFKLMQKKGKVDTEEMFHVFNMGIGMVVVCSPDDAGRFTQTVPEARVVGEVLEQKGTERVVIGKIRSSRQGKVG